MEDSCRQLEFSKEFDENATSERARMRTEFISLKQNLESTAVAKLAFL